HRVVQAREDLAARLSGGGARVDRNVLDALAREARVRERARRVGLLLLRGSGGVLRSRRGGAHGERDGGGEDEDGSGQEGESVSHAGLPPQLSPRRLQYESSARASPRRSSSETRKASSRLGA